MQHGTVKVYKSVGGYGFIKPDDGSEDIFVHISQCAEGIDELSEGQRVGFERGLSRQGRPEAKRVHLL